MLRRIDRFASRFACLPERQQLAMMIGATIGGPLQLETSAIIGLVLSASLTLLPISSVHAFTLDWTTVVNNGVLAPGATTEEFFSYNQPSVNDFGLVVFRARARPDTGGSGGAPIRGVFVRDMSTAGNAIVAVTQVGDTVPQPNNLDATFNEFPAFPRIDSGSSMIVTRGQTTPVWQYTLSDLTETRVGTAGLFTTATPLLGGANLSTGANQLGSVPGFEAFSVPGAPPGTKFDQFPGAAGASDGQYIVFKGNYQDGGGKTGVYFRDVTQADAPVIAIANTNTDIPDGGGIKFGSTAPPSAANGRMVFTGLDNEEAPTKGGIYLAPLQQNAPLTALVSIGTTEVPGQSGQTLNRVGEGLSFDGRYVAFWGAWGTETRDITLSCPTDGNAAAACAQQYPTGFQTTVPINQGIFRMDTQTGQLTLVAKTDPSNPGGFDDFLYWTFSGAVEGGGGEGDAEPPRWRSSAFAALDGERVAFKGTKINESEVVGLYGLFGDANPLFTLLDTTMLGTALDPDAPVASYILTMGIERDGFRNGWLAINASMLYVDPNDPENSVGWGGIYLTQVPVPLSPAVWLLGSTLLVLVAMARRQPSALQRYE